LNGQNMPGERERTAQRQDSIADFQPGHVAERRDGKSARGLRSQLQDGDIRQRIGADEFGGDFLATRQGAANRAGLAGDVMVRDDMPVGGDDGPAAGGFALQFTALLVVDRDDVNPNEARRHLRERGFDGGGVLGRGGRRRLGRGGSRHAADKYRREQSAHRAILSRIHRGNLLSTPPAFRWRFARCKP
jgi:hypothetical protein